MRVENEKQPSADDIYAAEAKHSEMRKDYFLREFLRIKF